MPWLRDNKRSYGDGKQRAEAARDFFGPRRAIRDITPMLIEKYKSHLRKTNSKYQRPFAPSTINRYLTVLSGVLSMAFANAIIDSNPMERVALLQEPEPRERYLNQHAVDEEERLINALAPFGEHLVAMAELDLETGMRLG